MHWNMTPHHTLSLTYSHNERLPTPMELYYQGKHLATNSLEHGNKDLRKERSDNMEVSLAFEKGDWNYTLTSYYSHFKNHIFNQILRREGDLTINRYTQSKARYYGFEGKVDYQLSSMTQVGIWGDYVRGKLYDLPPPLAPKESEQVYVKVPQVDRNAPRVPPLRLGLHLQHKWTNDLTSSLNYTYVFTQNKVTDKEKPIKGYRLLDLGITYQKNFGRISTELYANLNNELDQKVYSHTSFLPFVPQMGRNLVMGVNLKF